MKLLIIIKKELLDQIRDNRTIIAAILMPAVIVPLLLFLTSRNITNEELKGPVRIIINNTESHLKNLILESVRDTRFVNSSSPSEAIINGKAELQRLVARSGGRYKALTLYYDSARRTSVLSYFRIHGFLKSYFKKSEITARDLKITSLTIRSEKENKTILTLSLILPVFLMVFAASSSMSSVIDMSSGEKERSTIETLLSSNISHITIILGKIFAASTIGFTSVLSLLAGLIICSHIYPRITGGLSLLNFSGFTNISLMILMTSMSVFLFAAAGMAIGLYAKSVKEGTIVTLPVIVLSSALSSGLIAGDPFTVNKFYLLVPILNFSHLIRAVIYNHHEYFLIMISVFVNLACAVLFLIISGYLLKKETVIFRS
ncbi:MAG: ABC transporter permease [Spirochaetes bacterium]|nr:ABC transporter permease [Spirochaetota bacterium]